MISPCFANWVLSQDAVHWNVKVSTTCASSNYSVSSWNQSNQIINVGQYFAYIIGQFRDFDLFGIWDPHLVRNLAGDSRLCLTQWDASTSHVSDPTWGKDGAIAIAVQLCRLPEPKIIKSSHHEEHNRCQTWAKKTTCPKGMKCNPFRSSSRISLDSKQKLCICSYHM